MAALITRLTAQEVAAAVAELPAMPSSIAEVISACDDQDMTVGQLSQVVLRDQSLTANILKLANSAAFGRPRPAAALTPDVLMSIGIQSVRQVVLAFSLVSGNREGHCPDFDYELFLSLIHISEPTRPY